MAGTHAGHRDRLRERARENLEGFQPHEVLEFLLFYTIPRRNTNPDGHRLLDAFGSAKGALMASPEELTRVPGIGERSAQWLHCLGTLLQAYRDLTSWERPMLGNVRLVRAFLETHFPEIPEEGVWLICLTAEGRLLLAGRFAERGKWAEEKALARAVNDPMRLHAHSVLLLQFCLEGVEPSPYDLKNTRRLAGNLRAMDAHLLDHLLYNGRELYSMFAHQALNGPDPLGRTDNPLREHYLDGME